MEIPGRAARPAIHTRDKQRLSECIIVIGSLQQHNHILNNQGKADMVLLMAFCDFVLLCAFRGKGSTWHAVILGAIAQDVAWCPNRHSAGF